jgi:hypothetical protein
MRRIQQYSEAQISVNCGKIETKSKKKLYRKMEIKENGKYTHPPTTRAVT